MVPPSIWLSKSKPSGVIVILFFVPSPVITLYIQITLATSLTITVAAIFECLLYFRHLEHIIASPYKFYKIYIVVLI